MKNALCGLLLLLLAWSAACAADQAALRIYAMESRPISFMEGGQPSGLVVEMAREVQRRIGDANRIEVVPWARANLLAQKEPNVLLLSIIRTPERDRYLRTIGPVFQLHMACYALRSRAAALRARDPSLRSLRAGARRGSVFIKLARDAGYNLKEEINGSDTAVRMLMAGRFELLLDGDEIISGAMRRQGLAPTALEVMAPLGVKDVNFAFSQGTPEAVIQAWDAALRDMKRDGSYQAIVHRWLPEPALLPAGRQQPAKGGSNGGKERPG